MAREGLRDAEEALLRLLLVRACEERDPRGRFLPAAERDRATREARDRANLDREPARTDVQAFLAIRSDGLWHWLVAHFPAFRHAVALARVKLGLLLVVVVGAFAGLLLDELGNARRINLLSFPLVGLLLWNGGVYVVLAAAAVRRRFRGRVSWDGGSGVGVTGILRTAIRRFVSQRWIRSRDRSPEEVNWIGASIERFFVLWHDRFGALESIRTRRLLHAGAAAIATGVVAGMYVRGFAFEYRATWESTFLEAPEVHALLSWILAPAALVLGIEMPDVGGIAGLRAPSDGPAARWIHLWGVTTLLAIALPRALLALVSVLRARRLARSLFPGTEDPYVRRLLLQGRVERPVVELRPYSHSPSERILGEIRALSLELFGNRTQVLSGSPVPYGDEFPPDDGDGRHRVVLFSIAQSPEQEVHGELLETAKHAARHDGSFLLACIDAEPYRQIADARRLEERIGAWRRLVRECGLEVVVVGGEASDDAFASLLASAGSALWPTEPERVA